MATVVKVLKDEEGYLINLPEDCRFEGDEVNCVQIGDFVILSPADVCLDEESI